MKDEIQILVVDDERPARRRIARLLDRSPLHTIVTEASSGTEATHQLATCEFHIVFLDMQLTDMSGLDVLQHANFKNARVIFVTAYDDYALHAFDAQAVDYLLKPYTYDRFNQALDRALAAIKVNQIEDTRSLAKNIDSTTQKIPIKLSNKYYFVSSDEIKYLKASGSYVEIHTIDHRKHLCRSTLNGLTQMLEPKSFFRINRSTTINVELIKEVIREGYGEYFVKMLDGKSFTVSKRHKIGFFEKLNIKK